MTKLITNLRTAIANRRAYSHALAEIASIDARDLAELNVDREMLIANVHQRVYGAAR